MELPVFFRVDPPAPFEQGFDWFPIVQKVLKQIGHEIVAVVVNGDRMSVRTGPSGLFIPTTIDVCRTPEGFAVRWAHSETKLKGWRQRIHGRGEDSARFYVVLHEEYRARFSKLTEQEWVGLWGSAGGQAPRPR
jgi:hypothetical protein